MRLGGENNCDHPEDRTVKERRMNGRVATEVVRTLFQRRKKTNRVYGALWKCIVLLAGPKRFNATPVVLLLHNERRYAKLNYYFYYQFTSSRYRTTMQIRIVRKKMRLTKSQFYGNISELRSPYFKTYTRRGDQGFSEHGLLIVD